MVLRLVLVFVTSFDMVILNKEGKKKKLLSPDEKRMADLDLFILRDNTGNKYLCHRDVIDPDHCSKIENGEGVW